MNEIFGMVILALNTQVCVPLFQYFMYFNGDRAGEPWKGLYYEVPVEINKSTPLEVQNHKAPLWATMLPGEFSHSAQVRVLVSRKR